MGYSIFNLIAFLNQADIGDRLGINLWNYQTADGRSLRKGVEYLIPFATGAAPFPYKQITPLRRSHWSPSFDGRLSVERPETRPWHKRIKGPDGNA